MNLARLSNLFKEFGVRVGLVYGLDRLLRKCSSRLGLHWYVLVEQQVHGKPLLPPAHAQNVRFVELKPGASELSQVPRPLPVLEERFAQGAVCLAVYLKERYVGYAWFAFRSYEEDEVRCSYLLRQPTHAAFDFDVYVFPAYRLGRAFAAVWHASNQYLGERGVTRTCSRIAASNLASRRSHGQLGAREIGHALFLCLGSWQVTWSSLLAFPGLRFGKTSRPALHL